MINIDELKKYEPLYVIGHKSPDVDTMVSSYVLSNIFTYLGVKTYPCILSDSYEIDAYNKKIINDYLEFNPVIINRNDCSKYNFILVDHNNPNQSVGTNFNVVLCIDHHKDCGKVNNTIIGNICSNSLFIYSLFKNIYNFSYKEKELIMIATLTDTLFLKSDRYKEEDSLLVKELDVDFDSNELLNKYFIETDLSMGLDKYLEKSDRDFSYCGVEFTSSVIQLLGVKNNIIEDYKHLVINRTDNHLGMLRDLVNNKTYVFFKINDNLIEIKYDFIAGRANRVIPDILKYLN